MKRYGILGAALCLAERKATLYLYQFALPDRGKEHAV